MASNLAEKAEASQREDYVRVEALERVITFAMQAHKEQKYGNDKPYSYHLRKVEEVLGRFGENSYEMVAAAWLHDVVEDCKVPIEEIEKQFGKRVAELVWAVTDEPGQNRAERHRRTYPKLRKTKGAIRLKLADRIANVEECLLEKKENGKSKLLKMYQAEFEDFVEALFVEGEEEEMWWHLKDLMMEEPEVMLI